MNDVRNRLVEETREEIVSLVNRARLSWIDRLLIELGVETSVRFLEKGRAGVRPVRHGPRLRVSHPAGRPGPRLRLRRGVRRGLPRRSPAEVVLRRLGRPVRRVDPRPVRPLGVPAGLPGGTVRDDLHGPFVCRRDRPPDRRHLFPRVRDPGGLRVPAAARGDGGSPLQEDRLQRQGGASDDPRARVRHDGDLDHADPRDAQGAGDRHAAAGARGPVLGAAGGDPRNAVGRRSGRDDHLGRA